MQTILRDIPTHLVALVEVLRARLRDPLFLDRHRVRAQDFTRDRQLTFPVLMLFVLQKTVKSIQRHLHDFLGDLSLGQLFAAPTAGAVTLARAKLKETAFTELNRECLLPAAYGPGAPVQRWREHRLLGLDSSLIRLPKHEELGATYGWKYASNQHGDTGTRYPEARLSVLYDLLNRYGHDVQLEPSTTGEVAMAIGQLSRLQPGDVAVTDRGYTGYVYLAQVLQHRAHCIARCSSGSFACAQEMFRLNRANRSKEVWLYAPTSDRAECQKLGLPLKIRVRFVSVRLPTGELEVLATSLLDQVLYPTEEFLTVYHWRWGHETFHLMLKGRLELENFSGHTLEAVKQDVQAAVFLTNLESLLIQPAQDALDERKAKEVQPLQVNHSISYHTIKAQVLDLLYRDIPAPEVLAQMIVLFQASPVAIRPDRKAPRRNKPSFHRAYHFQRRVKKTVF